MEEWIIKEPDAEHCDGEGIPEGIYEVCDVLGEIVREMLDKGDDYYGNVPAIFIESLIGELKSEGKHEEAEELESRITRGRHTLWADTCDIAETSEAMPWLRRKLPAKYLLLEAVFVGKLLHDCMIFPCELEGGLKREKPDVKVLYRSDTDGTEYTATRDWDYVKRAVFEGIPQRAIYACLNLERIADFVICTLNMQYAKTVIAFSADFLSRDNEWPEGSRSELSKLRAVPCITAEDEIRSVRNVMALVRKFCPCSYRDLVVLIGGGLYINYAENGFRILRSGKRRPSYAGKE